jgi:pimeloyl-ACP methyl ester carboxylesterase
MVTARFGQFCAAAGPAADTSAATAAITLMLANVQPVRSAKGSFNPWSCGMTHLTTDDSVKLFFEEVGSGAPIVFVHEFAGDSRSWQSQVRYFSRKYRCITFNARGYPPSDVPDSSEKYSQERARDDIKAVVDALEIDRAHVVGLSMGGFAALHFGFAYPDRARSLVVAGCGYGAAPDKRAQFAAETEVVARHFEELGMTATAEAYALGPSRVQFQN